MDWKIFIIFFYTFAGYVQCTEKLRAEFSPDSVSMLVKETAKAWLVLSGTVNSSTMFHFTYLQDDGTIDKKIPKKHRVIEDLHNVTVPANSSNASFHIQSVQAGKILIGLNVSAKNADLFTELDDVHMTVNVQRSNALGIIIIIVGWIYFVAWSVSFYPQVVLNYRRKSVVGLNFDFLAYNLTGFLAYGLFNIGMYWIPTIKEQYQDKYPWSVNPVLLNDVIFTLHAIVITSVTIVQCIIYEKGGQRVSRLSMVLIAGCVLFAIITLIIACFQVISWLDYLTYFSYIKLGVTLIKYIPQAFMNYKRKSTEGWSIGNVLLDFTGGALSILQMFLLSFNNNDWTSIFGDPTKFGLGFFSILFDILFIVQHYVLYRGNQPYEPVPDEVVSVGNEDGNYSDYAVQ